MSLATQLLIGMGVIVLCWLCSIAVERLALHIHLSGLEAQRRRAVEREADTAPAAMSTERKDAALAVDVRSEAEKAPAAAEPAPNEPANTANTAAESRTEAGTGAVAVELSEDEVRAVRRLFAYVRNARQPTKAAAIEAAFGVKRGGGRRYQRASELYDLLCLEPEPEGPRFGARSPEQQAVQTWIKSDDKLATGDSAVPA